MFDYLNGTLVYKNYSDNPSITIDVNGIGYFVFISSKDFSNLPDLDANLKIFTVLIHKEDSMSLYGFLERDVRAIFNILTSVSGVGPKMAMQILSSFEVEDLISAVLNENAKSLTTAKGVGSKLAQKIVIELKDKLKDFNNCITKVVNSNIQNVDNTIIVEVQDVLSSFGYEKEEIISAIEYSISKSVKKDSVEDILKEALKFLSE